jgi:hypothetical protein
MIKQTLTWSALPKSSNGPLQAGTELRLSVFVAPRLWNSDASVISMTLSDFPDWLDWPALISQTSFQIELDGGPSLAATPENVDLRSDIWQALFKPTTTVKPFVFEDLSGVHIKTFAAGTIHDTLKDVYQRASIELGSDLPDREKLADDPVLTEIARSVRPLPEWIPPETDRGPVFVGDEEAPDENGDKPEGCGCTGCLLWPVQIVRRLLTRLGISVPAGANPGAENEEPKLATESQQTGSSEMPASARAEPEGLATTTKASATAQAFNDLQSYLQTHSEMSHPLPTLAEVENTYDFHSMISSLGDYPTLMRRLGLVVDLVVTLDTNLPANLGKVKVVPSAPMTTPTPVHFSPFTHYDLGTERFLARTRSGSDLANGLLRLDDANRFKVVQTDVAGGGTKLQNTATNLCGARLLGTWAPNAPREAGLPALQTAGISIVRSEQVSELSRRFVHGYAMQSFVTSLDASPLLPFAGGASPPAASDELWADDLVRGYRLDIWDDRSNQWHSLCRRIGDYEFTDGASGPISLTADEDEGFVQMAATESLDDEPEREIRVHESLFTWDGWSLVAPRPGLTILPDHTTGETVNTPQTQFKMETAFQARPGSLPRLRFGWQYRVRARMVDLAGNSPFAPDDPAFKTSQPEATPPFQLKRYEPVAPPPLVLRTVPVEGESVEHMVVRSSIHDLPAQITSQEAERHVVPPKTSQLMAERHGVFDGTSEINKDQTAYDLASREAGSVTERMNFATGTLELIPGTVKHEDAAQKRVFWLQTNDTFEVAFLPDNFARGVVLLGLPGMPSPTAVIDGVNRIEFTGTWPDLEAFRLRLRGLQAGAAPAQPAWSGGDRVLTVEVPQGETVRLRYCSYLLKADLELMGIWEWVKEVNPTNLSDLEKQVTDGRNWLHLPFREMVLVHAVQQPLAIPVASQLAITPVKQVGETQVKLNGQIDIDAKSTGKIDLRATWTDPFDDPAKASFNPVTDEVKNEMHVTEAIAHDAANNQLAVQGVTHALGDTKYHKVTYTAIGTTRYREYFPPAVLANPKDLVRPTPAETGTPPADNARFVLDIPNSARPAAVKPLYAVPAFAWTSGDNAGIITKNRRGGGLRLYMDRPWYSSGDGELLGLVLRPAKYQAVSKDWMTLRKYVSEWGMDPLWRAAETAPLSAADFANSVAQGNNLSLAELDLDVDVIGFEAQYDTDRNLWFCDIAFDVTHKYFPFIRMALARYQPISVDSAHLSRVVLSDFAQVLPHRTVRYDTNLISSNSTVEIRVNGPAYYHRENKDFASPIVIARIERRLYDTGDDLGWEVVGTQQIPPVQQSPEETVWQAEVPLPGIPPSPMRIVVLEAEVYAADPRHYSEIEQQLRDEIFPRDDHTPGMAGQTHDIGYRIVFADAIELP